MRDFPVVQASCIEKTIISPYSIEWFGYRMWKSTKTHGFVDSQFYSFDLYILLPVLPCLDYSSFAVSFEITKSESSYFVFVLFLFCFLRMFWLLWVPQNFMWMLKSAWQFKKSFRSLIEVALNLWIDLRNIPILLSSSNPWTWHFLLFRSLIFIEYFVIFSIYIVHFC